ncbi:MAG: SDR family oxidoreductase [Oxalobacteraceae bacterium]|nr:MAG: SDR family oxidoreductase [Oxalobacteraceae bacterium]
MALLGSRIPAERLHSPRPAFRVDCLEGRRIFVTGASSGIGRAASIALSRCGAHLVLNGRDAARLEETRALLAGEGHSIAPGALSDADATAALIKGAAKDGAFDGIFHAAGFFQVLPAKITKQAQLDATFNASVFGAYGIARAASAKAVLNNGGSIVFMSSIAGEHGSAGLTAYAGAKAAILGLTRALAMELAPRLIRVNSILASTIETEMHERTMENAQMDYVAMNLARHPLGFGKPAAINDAVTFLLSDASAWVTGATMAVDGGYSAG